MSMADQIWAYFRECEWIDKAKRLGFNALGPEVAEFSVEDEPESPILAKYMDGSTLRSKTFVLASRQEYGLDARLNIEKSGFFEKIRKWIEKQDKAKNYPVLEDGCTVNKIEALTDGYLYTSEKDSARYQIQLRIIYFEKGER